MLAGLSGGRAMVRNMGALGDLGLFCHIFDIFCPDLQL